MTDDFQTFVITRGDDRQICVVFDDIAGIDQPIANLARERGFGKSRANVTGNVGDADGLIKLSLAAVGQRNRRHGPPLADRAVRLLADSPG
jgi:hypothetical protein